jgi:hypothetical protein
MKLEIGGRTSAADMDKEAARVSSSPGGLPSSGERWSFPHRGLSRAGDNPRRHVLAGWSGAIDRSVNGEGARG